MAIQKKNLLEAFQASAAAEKIAASATEGTATPKAGGPFAPTPTSSPEVPLENSGARGWRPDAAQRLVALVALIAVAAFFLGRASVSSVGASDRDGAAPTSRGDGGAVPATSGAASASLGAGQRAASAPAESDSQPLTSAERALSDPRNRYTVKLVEYRKGRDDTLAMQTLVWLQSQGHPAVAKYQGRQLFILLGAAETQAQLDELLQTAKTMTGPPPLSKEAEFHDAYVVAIDRLIER